jgi:hypothetical protein
LKDNGPLWEKWVYIFHEKRQLKSIAFFLPNHKPQLSASIYELVLNEFIREDHARLLQIIEDWPCTLYHIPTIIKSVEEQRERTPTPELLQVCFPSSKLFENVPTNSQSLKNPSFCSLLLSPFHSRPLRNSTRTISNLTKRSRFSFASREAMFLD